MPLSAPKGPYAVSTLTLEVPASRTLPPSRFRRRGQQGESADPFRLQTVLLTLFYPTERKQARSQANGKPLSWLNEPRLKAIEGLLKYGNLSRYLAYPAVFLVPFNAKLPYGSDGPLASTSPSLIQSDKPQTSEPPASAQPNTDLFPVGVFSHGLAGSRTTYSAYLGELASEGMVIASVEHRDGSCPYTRVRKRTNGQGQASSGIVEEDQLYTQFDELEHDRTQDGAEMTAWDMRKAQLDLRQSEVLEAVDVLRQLNDGLGERLAEQSTRPIDAVNSQLTEWKGKLDLANMWALGHSFGGATCIELLRRETSPFTHAVVLDPWLEPIAKVDEVSPIKRPLYAINSEAFTIWRKHFAWLRSLVAEAHRETGSGWLMSMTKTKHTDFSDFPFLMPRFFKPAAGARPPSEVLAVFSRASRMEFVGQFDRVQLGMPIRDERPGEVEARDLGEGGFVVWHPLDNAAEQTPKL